MPVIDKVFNATLEKQEVMINSKMYTILPRSFCDVNEFHSPIMEQEHATKGLVVIRPGDDFKAKERIALIAYLERLTERIRNYQAWMDQKKLEGKTVEQPIEMKRAMRWKDEIETMLNLAKPLVEEVSYKDISTPTIFAEKPQVIENPYEQMTRKRGRPAKSFAELSE